MDHQLTPEKETISVAGYLFARLLQLQIGTIFGVPGDYNLRLLDFVEPSGLHWVGNCNELNAAYAADGYARINGLGALITTFGVGELSAINGIAGPYAEKAAVVHIVGTPSRALQESRTLLHHTFADGDYQRFATIHSHVTVAQVNLMDPRKVPDQIDWALEQALIHSRPVYIQVPDDMVDIKVSASTLKSRKIAIPPILANADQLSTVLTKISERIYSAKQPMILVDGESRSLGILNQVESLVKLTEWPTWTTPFGKGLVNEQIDNVYGIYFGIYGDEQSQRYFQSADLIINFGPHHSDTNTQGFSAIPNQSATISFSGNIKIGNEIYRDMSSQQVLSTLLLGLDQSKISKVEGPPKPNAALGHLDSSESITQEKFYRFMNPLFRVGDIILTETGTASHGGRNFILPANTRLLSAVTWLSIGYMLPAALGTGLAQREINQSKVQSPNINRGRVILFIGDGSLQMTAQEISTMIKENLDMIIIIINNDGYTIERAIHGRKQAYNDITSWNHLQTLSFFGADEDHTAKNTFRARTWGELEGVLNSKQIQQGTGLRILEVFMGREDCPGLLLSFLNKQIAREEK